MKIDWKVLKESAQEDGICLAILLACDSMFTGWVWLFVPSHFAKWFFVAIIGCWLVCRLLGTGVEALVLAVILGITVSITVPAIPSLKRQRQEARVHAEQVPTNTLPAQ